MINLESKDFLSKEQIKEQTPSVFTNQPASNVSKHYTHIPTSIIIDDMEKLGWKVSGVQEVKARKSIGFQKHLIVFRNPEVVINGEDGDTVFPQVLLTNSHDGKNAFTFTAGLFRLVCANGLVVSTEEFENVKMRHMGYKFEDLQVKIRGMVEALPLTVESMNKMKSTQIKEKEAIKFAKKALTTRFTKEQIKVFKIDLKELIKPTRTEDAGGDVWSVFNVVQEKIITGDFEYNMGGKVRKAREIKNFNQDINVNKKLFAMANELVPQEIAS